MRFDPPQVVTSQQDRVDSFPWANLEEVQMRDRHDGRQSR
jgi:hypothetical protein